MAGAERSAGDRTTAINRQTPGQGSCQGCSGPTLPRGTNPACPKHGDPPALPASFIGKGCHTPTAFTNVSCQRRVQRDPAGRATAGSHAHGKQWAGLGRTAATPQHPRHASSTHRAGGRMLHPGGAAQAARGSGKQRCHARGRRGPILPTLEGQAESRQNPAFASLLSGSAPAPSGLGSTRRRGCWPRRAGAGPGPAASTSLTAAGPGPRHSFGHGHVPAGELWFPTGGCRGGFIDGRLLPQLWPRAWGGREPGTPPAPCGCQHKHHGEQQAPRQGSGPQVAARRRR